MIRYVLFVVLTFTLITSSASAAKFDPTQGTSAMVVHYNDIGTEPEANYEEFFKEFSERVPAESKMGFMAGRSFKGTAQMATPLSHLAILTHGATSRWKNETRLMHLGGFGSQGSFGLLAELIQSQAEAGGFAEHLHIYLDSCSTFCGKEEKIKQRVEGLYQDLKPYGVKKLSVWGARGLVAAGLKKQRMKYHEQVFDFLKFTTKFVGGIAVTVGVVTGGYAAYTGFDPDVVDRLSRGWIFNGIYLGTVWTAGLLSSAILYLFVTDQGYLVTATDQGVELKSVKLGTPEAMTGRCEQALVGKDWPGNI